MIKIYTTNWCPSCVAAKKLLNSLNIEFDEINIEEKQFSRNQLQELTGGYTVPQIVIKKICIGGYDKLLYLYQNDKLDGLLNEK
tara:strand:+ start:2047 stop:2298 length:252 start_codon:yes stop_codon:yes gene_type:complete